MVVVCISNGKKKLGEKLRVSRPLIITDSESKYLLVCLLINAWYYLYNQKIHDL